MIRQNSFETGLSDGTQVTSSRSDYGTAGDPYQVGNSGPHCVFTAAAAHRGALGVALDAAASESTQIQFNFVGAEQQQTAARMYVRFRAWPSGYSPFMDMREAASNYPLDIGVHSTGKIWTRSNDAIHTKTLWSSGDYPVLQLNTWYRVEAIVTTGTTSSNGRVQVAIYAGNSTSPSWTLDTGSSVNAGTSGVAYVRFGRVQGGSGPMSLDIDDIAYSDTAAFIGAAQATNTAPTVSGNTYLHAAAGEPFTFSWDESDADGTISSRSVQRQSGPGPAPSLSQPTPTSRQGTWTTENQGQQVYRVIAMDNDGALSAEHDITINVAAPQARPHARTTNSGGYTTVGSDPVDVVADDDDATYIESPADPSGAVVEYAIRPVLDGPVTINVRGQASDNAAAITRTIELRQDATVIASWTIATLPTSWDTFSATTDAQQTAQITDPAALRVRIIDTVN